MKLDKIRKKLKKLTRKVEKQSAVQPEKLQALEEKLLKKKSIYQEKLHTPLSDSKRKSYETKLKVTNAQLKKLGKLSAAMTEDNNT